MELTDWRRPFLLEAGFQNYAWGDASFIPELFGFAGTARPFAEAWYGAHPRLPSLLHVGRESCALDRLLELQGVELLGRDALDRHGGLPYLVKVLAAERPLSIQVHPNAAEAQAGFAREQARGVPLTAEHRNYRDRNHKPELLLALTPFFALCGFRPLPQIEQSLGEVPELAGLLPPFEPTPASLERLVRGYLALAPGPRSDALAAWVQRLERQRARWGPSEVGYWVLEADAATRSSDRTHDRGLFFFLLLELFQLSPGQALFLSAGIPHAYLKGAGVEVMANSDNVLRCGLTQKHTDPEELLKIVVFDAPSTQLVDPPRPRPGEWRHFALPISEFKVETLELDAGRSVGPWTAEGPELLVATNATASVEVGQPSMGVRLDRGGRACLIPHGTDYRIQSQRASELVRVTVPHG